MVYSNQGTTTVSAGNSLNLEGWRDIFVVEIGTNHILFDDNRILVKGGSIYFYISTDGYEDNEGVVWYTNEYKLRLEWL